jgi:hypothetical protein
MIYTLNGCVILGVCNGCNLQLKPKKIKKRGQPKLDDFNNYDLIADAEIDLDGEFVEESDSNGDDVKKWAMIPVVFHNLKRLLMWLYKSMHYEIKIDLAIKVD